MRFRGTLVLTFFLLCVMVMAGATENITFQLLRGRASLARSSGSTWLDLGPEPINVKTQDMLRTEGETRGELHFPDGSLFRIKSSSHVTILAGGLLIQVGEVWLNLKKQGKAFQVITPTTICNVLGTTFDVAVDKFGRTNLRVFEGLVSMKARDDQRLRQLVLQRGMQAAVRERGITGSQIQKFDPGAAEAEIDREWDRKVLPPMKIGPERPGLPPIRPSLPDGLKSLNQKNSSSAGPQELPDEENAVTTDVRDRMNFFENLRAQRMQERGQRDKNRDQTQEEGSRQQFPGQPFGPQDKASSGGMLRQGHGRPFGQATPAPTGILDERMLREEILKVQNDLMKVQEQIKQVMATQAPTPPTIRQLQLELTTLRDQHHKLLLRFNDLRNRLR